MGGRKSELFLMGMFSLLDAMIDRPLREALRDIRLSQDIRDTLLSDQPANGPISIIYYLAQAYECGDWPQVLVHAGQLRLESAEIRGAYFKAVNWCDQVFGTLSNPVSARDHEPVQEPIGR
jgi:EAL and modified HD-GYP domain-containing signal transduction protein